jgi:hypothetical protein
MNSTAKAPLRGFSPGFSPPSGILTDYAAAAEIGHVTRARLTQIMNRLHLAPDIQEALLFLPRVECGRDPITERDVRPIVAVSDWRKQRRLWKSLLIHW